MLLQLYNVFYFIKGMVPASDMRRLVRWAFVLVSQSLLRILPTSSGRAFLLPFSCLAQVLASIGVVFALAMTGQVPFLTGRMLALLGATKNIAIVKSVRGTIARMHAE